mmetsp:Transcript_9154/g.18730  ORF Transcript_9154/g.18730 Transcript_9154/m.18730 type:complete len:266 (+) Transcript_9154:162-959(+)
MIFFLVLLVTLIEAAQSLQGAERLLQFESLEALNAENFNLTDSDCVFNFTDLLSDEVTCIGNITAPNTAAVTVSSVLTGGNCTDMSIAPPDILSSNITRDNDKVISTVQFARIPVPLVQGDISLTEFCLTTNILYEGIDMLNQKKPISVEFQYDGSFEITAGVAQNVAIGEKVEDKTIFTANLEELTDSVKDKTVFTAKALEALSAVEDITLPRYLEEAEEDGSFDLDVKIETRGALSGSVLSSKSPKTNLSVVVVLLSALYCFD